MRLEKIIAQNIIGKFWYLVDLDNEVGDDDIQDGEHYLEHTQVKPNRYDLYRKEAGDSIENSFLILGTNDPSVKPTKEAISYLRKHKLEYLIND